MEKEEEGKRKVRREKGHGKEEKNEERMRKGLAQRKERGRGSAASLSPRKKKGKDRRKGAICGLGLLFEKHISKLVSLRYRSGMLGVSLNSLKQPKI